MGRANLIIVPIITELHAKKIFIILYLPSDFQGGQRRDPWKSKIFLVRGLTKEVERGQDLSKTLFVLYNQKNFFQCSYLLLDKG